MRRASLVALFLLLAMAAPTAQAVKTYGSTVILPIVGRTPGAFDTQWRTEVFIQNIGGLDISGTMTFFVSDGSIHQADFALGPLATVSYHDVVKSVFGLDEASGQLHIEGANGRYVEARARIFNSGNPAGEFGQGVEGIGLEWLQIQARVFGLDGRAGSRVNVGVANPNSSSLQVTMRISDKANNELYREDITLAARRTLQFNDIFARFGIAPQDSVMVEFYSSSGLSAPIYGYASEVRNDTGDAVFVYGTGPNAP